MKVMSTGFWRCWVQSTLGAMPYHRYLPDPYVWMAHRQYWNSAKGDAYKVIQRHECDLVPDDDIRKLIHALNEVSDGQMIAPHTFEPIDWMKGYDREDLKGYWDRLEKDRRDRRERDLRIRMGYPD